MANELNDLRELLTGMVDLMAETAQETASLLELTNHLSGTSVQELRKRGNALTSKAHALRALGQKVLLSKTDHQTPGKA